MLVKKDSVSYRLYKETEKQKSKERIDPNCNPKRTLSAQQKLDMTEKKIRIIEKQNYICPVCKKELNGVVELAHRICKSKANIKLYGWEILDHELNLPATHKECNSAVLISKPKEIKALIEKIEQEG